MFYYQKKKGKKVKRTQKERKQAVLFKNVNFTKNKERL